MPSAPGKTSYIAKGAVFRGELGFSLGLMHRFDSDQPFALSASVARAGGDNTSATVAFSGEFQRRTSRIVERGRGADLRRDEPPSGGLSGCACAIALAALPIGVQLWLGPARVTRIGIR
jgi:hypothetical protein